MKLKESGYVLSIDQASNAAGVTLWLDGELQAWVLLTSNSKKDPFALRVQTQVAQLEAWLSVQLPYEDQVIKQILFEGVRARLVLCTVGAFCTPKKIQAPVTTAHSFIESTTWKVWARNRGATGPVKDIKGVKALREIGFPLDRYPITSEDIADSCLLYLCWRDR